LPHFYLDPAFHAPGAIGRVLLLAYDPFEAHGAGALLDLRAVALSPQVFGKENALGCVRQQLGEQALALDERRSAQIEAVEIEQVESVVEQPIPATPCEVGVQQPKIRDAARIHDDGFAAQDQVLRREGHERIGDGSEAERPVVAPPRVHGRPPASQVRLGAVATELDFVQPAPA
jgi:hypothetical protein